MSSLSNTNTIAQSMNGIISISADDISANSLTTTTIIATNITATTINLINLTLQNLTTTVSSTISGLINLGTALLACIINVYDVIIFKSTNGAKRVINYVSTINFDATTNSGASAILGSIYRNANALTISDSNLINILYNNVTTKLSIGATTTDNTNDIINEKIATSYSVIQGGTNNKLNITSTQTDFTNATIIDNVTANYKVLLNTILKLNIAATQTDLTNSIINFNPTTSCNVVLSAANKLNITSTQTDLNNGIISLNPTTTCYVVVSSSTKLNIGANNTDNTNDTINERISTSYSVVHGGLNTKVLITSTQTDITNATIIENVTANYKVLVNAIPKFNVSLATTTLTNTTVNMDGDTYINASGATNTNLHSAASAGGTINVFAGNNNTGILNLLTGTGNTSTCNLLTGTNTGTFNLGRPINVSYISSDITTNTQIGFFSNFTGTSLTNLGAADSSISTLMTLPAGNWFISLTCLVNVTTVGNGWSLSLSTNSGGADNARRQSYYTGATGATYCLISGFFARPASTTWYLWGRLSTGVITTTSVTGQYMRLS